MTRDEAVELVIRYFQVKARAEGREFNVPASVDEAKELLGEDEVSRLEQEVSTKED